MLEVIATSVEDAIVAERAGADRLELCVALGEDGLTPSLGLAEAVISSVDIPVHVIIRPHNRGFHYSKEDLAVMRQDIMYMKRAGAAGIVVGVLTENQTVDEDALSNLLQEAEGMQVTFHRAFDLIKNQFEALEILCQYPNITRVLTSGGVPKAIDGISQLENLILSVENKEITILVGSGLTLQNISRLLKETLAEELHFGSGVRKNQSFMEPIDEELIRKVKKELSSSYK